MDLWLSSDSHVVEPPSVWDRMPAKMRDAAPHIEEHDDADWWVFEGRKLYSFAGASKAGLRFEGRDKLKVEYKFHDVREGALDPLKYVEENEEDGVWGSVLYPSFAMNVTGSTNSEALGVMVAVYNDWLAEFCAPTDGRLKGVAMISVDRVDEAVAEVQRSAALGLAGVLIPVSSPPDRGYDLPEYDPLWEVIEDLGLPLSLHIGTNRVQAQKALLYTQVGLQAADYWVRDSLARLVFSGVFERFPRLQVVSVEHELGWVPHFAERLDYTYTEREGSASWLRFKDDKLPSDFLREQVAFSFQEDPIGLEMREHIGVENLLWGSDYPHTESTFPRSREIVTGLLSDLTDAERAAIVIENTRRLYDFKLPVASMA